MPTYNVHTVLINESRLFAAPEVTITTQLQRRRFCDLRSFIFDSCGSSLSATAMQASSIHLVVSSLRLERLSFIMYCRRRRRCTTCTKDDNRRKRCKSGLVTGHLVVGFGNYICWAAPPRRRWSPRGTNFGWRRWSTSACQRQLVSWAPGRIIPGLYQRIDRKPHFAKLFTKNWFPSKKGESRKGTKRIVGDVPNVALLQL